MSRPGDRLRALAARVFDARTLERLIDPVVADLQAEHRDAIHAGRLWRSRWVRLAGYAAFLQVIAVCVWREAMGAHWRWTDADRKTLGRTVGFALATVALLTLALHAPSVVVAGVREPSLRWLMLYMIPLSLPFTIPMALTIGCLYGLRNRVVCGRLVVSILVLAVACSAASFATLFWVAPAANRAYAVTVAQRTGADPPAAQKEPNELTLGEIRRQIQSPSHGDAAARRNVRAWEFYYFSLWALACAPIVWAVLGLSISACRPLGRVALAVLAGSAFLNYYILLYGSRTFTVWGLAPAYVSAWLPNLILLLIAASVAMVQPRRVGQA